MQKGRDKDDFLQADKHQIFLQVDTINFGEHGQPCPKYSNNKFAKSLQYLKNGQVSLIKLCHGNYLLHMSVKSTYK